jgi:septal ring factor EnvC (AmiA/AmiB activator)
MAKDRLQNLTNRSQDHSPSSEPTTPTSASPTHPNTPENLDSDLKAYLMMIVEDIKKDFNNSLKEIQENTAKELQVLIEKQENTSKEVMEMNKTIQDLKGEVDTIQKTQSEATLELENLEKKIWKHRCKHQQQNKRDGRENLRCRRFHREHRHKNQRKWKMQKGPNSKHPGKPGHNENTKPADNRSR